MANSVATFTTINGIMVHEDRNGTETSYVPDPLGNLIECRNSSGTKMYSAEYWPYGEIQASTGVNPSSWGFVGLLGYLIDATNMLYVRARYLMTQFAKWLTVDPLWPSEKAYVYVNGRSTFETDPSGLMSKLECILWALGVALLGAIGSIIKEAVSDPACAAALAACIAGLIEFGPGAMWLCRPLLQRACGTAIFKAIMDIISKVIPMLILAIAKCLSDGSSPSPCPPTGNSKPLPPGWKEVPLPSDASDRVIVA